jgi:drug/metabolite transporter (DMT)-like permease
MSLTQLLWGMACVFGISSGQILFKLAASTSGPIVNLDSLWHQILNFYLIISLLIYMITTILWVWLLRVVPLKQVYPLVALAFIIVPILARLFLNEKLELKTIIGGIIILIGVYISVR